MTIYLDDDYRCHLRDDGTRRAVETALFDGKCAAFIEGCRYVPEGECWTRNDGERFYGQMLSPAVNDAVLAAAQTQYEADEQTHLAELGALIEEIYNEDLEEIDNV